MDYQKLPDCSVIVSYKPVFPSCSGINLETNLLTAGGALLLLAAFLALGASLFNIWEVRKSWGRTSDFYNWEITVGTAGGGASLFNIWEVRKSWGRTSDFYNW
jgi:hypothetical protein